MLLENLWGKYEETAFCLFNKKCSLIQNQTQIKLVNSNNFNANSYSLYCKIILHVQKVGGCRLLMTSTVNEDFTAFWKNHSTMYTMD